uniref:Uncharacterized protein n=1 Tax=Cacopsylla melanoneura TaxID=428564 RepID=A0A8D8LJ45_9HEMI
MYLCYPECTYVFIPCTYVSLNVPIIYVTYVSIAYTSVSIACTYVSSAYTSVTFNIPMSPLPNIPLFSHCLLQFTRLTFRALPSAQSYNIDIIVKSCASKSLPRKYLYRLVLGRPG